MKKSILYILETFPQIESETFILNEINGLKELGNEIYVIAFYKSSALHRELYKYNILNNVSYIYIKRNTFIKIGLFVLTLLKDFITRPVWTFVQLNEIVKLRLGIRYLFHIYRALSTLPKVKIDIIHVSFADLNFLVPAWFLSLKLACYYSITFRAIDIYREISQEEIIMKDNLISKVNCQIITISRQNKDIIEKKFNPKREIQIIHDAINTEKFIPSESEKEKKLITVARFVEKKGIEYLLEAYKILTERGVDFKAVIIGSGGLKKNYNEYIHKSSLQYTVIIKPPMSQEEIIEELKTSMAFILPCIIAKNGDRDILPNVLKEAMAMEIPVITSNISGIDELIHDNINGILIPPKESKTIADSIVRLLDNEELRIKLGKNARKKVALDFNIRNETRKLNEVFDSLLLDDK